MADTENYPILICCKQLKPQYEFVQNLRLSSPTFSIGRSVSSSVIIPYLSISRNHCTFKRNDKNVWTLEDYSTFGIKVNGELVGKGNSKTLSDGDTIVLEQSEEFVYKFKIPVERDYVVPRKRMRMNENVDSNMINSMKIRFQESQTHEMEHIEQKLKNVKEMQTTTLILKKQLHTEMVNRITHLESKYKLMIQNLTGEKTVITQQKAKLEHEKSVQLAAIKSQMEEKISELMHQIQQHNETETDLQKENDLLKTKLEMERQEFLAELNRENSSKKDMLEKLEAKIKEQEEVRERERQEAAELLKREVEKLNQAKEQRIKEIEDQKKQIEAELAQMKDNLEEKVLQTEQEKLKTEQMLSAQIEQMKKLNDEEKLRMEKLVKEREEIQQKLMEAETKAAKSFEVLTSRVTERETELTALADERVQKQAEQSSEEINKLKEQLEKVKNQLEQVETEKTTILEHLCAPLAIETTAKQSVMSEVGEIMESELQCSICSELFVTATTLNCSHTFCKYCITTWKDKKKDCPICRAPIKSECKSLVLDTFIEKMVENLSEDMKQKRKDILKLREEEISHQRLMSPSTPRRRGRRGTSTNLYQTVSPAHQPRIRIARRPTEPTETSGAQRPLNLTTATSQIRDQIQIQIRTSPSRDSQVLTTAATDTVSTADVVATGHRGVLISDPLAQ